MNKKHIQRYESPNLEITLAVAAMVGCGLFVISILIADFVVPDHDWISDTISDLGAGEYEFIVDIGIYAFSASLICIALLAAHVHLGQWDWSVGIVIFALLGLIVFLVGARNEYGDNDSEGIVIHVYLVYALGLFFTLGPVCLMRGFNRVDGGRAKLLGALAVLWVVTAPIFFFLPDSIDGVYERGLGVIAMAQVIVIAQAFLSRAR